MTIHYSIYKLLKTSELYKLFLKTLKFDDSDKDFLLTHFPNSYQIFVHKIEDELIFRISSKDVLMLKKPFLYLSEENFYYLISESVDKKAEHKLYQIVDNFNEIIRESQNQEKLEWLKSLNSISKSIKEKLNSLELKPSTKLERDCIEIRKVYNNTNYTYGIFKGKSVLSKKAKKFYYEPSPSSRDDDYFEEFRFSTIEECIHFYYDCFLTKEKDL